MSSRKACVGARLLTGAGCAAFAFLAGLGCKDSPADAEAAPSKQPIEHAEAPSEEKEPSVEDLPPGATPALVAGRAVFAENCVKCHVEGLGDAPFVLDKQAWSARVAQPKETLYKHALEGFWGDIGEMPSKGDNDGLSDDEVRSAVDYIVSIHRGP